MAFTSFFPFDFPLRKVSFFVLRALSVMNTCGFLCVVVVVVGVVVVVDVDVVVVVVFSFCFFIVAFVFFLVFLVRVSVLAPASFPA